MEETVEQVPRRGGVLRRVLIVLVLLVLIAGCGCAAVMYTLLTGPSETAQAQVVRATAGNGLISWMPRMILGEEKTEAILSEEEAEQVTEVPLDNHNLAAQGEVTEEGPIEEDWSQAPDGIIVRQLNRVNYRAYVMLIQDPSRITVGTASDYRSGKAGIRVFDIAEREGCVAAINAGEFLDTGGRGDGGKPIGLTFTKGECAWNDGAGHTLIGFDNDNRLQVLEIDDRGIMKEDGEALGIRDAVCFMYHSTLVHMENGEQQLHYNDHVDRAQRVAIGQREDGTVIFILAEGRSAGSLGATRNEMVDLMAEQGVVISAMLDGGSSAVMYYPDYYKYYDVDTTWLNSYQKRGLVNQYKSFTEPRRLPTYFLVGPAN